MFLLSSFFLGVLFFLGFHCVIFVMMLIFVPLILMGGRITFSVLTRKGRIGVRFMGGAVRVTVPATGGSRGAGVGIGVRRLVRGVTIARAGAGSGVVGIGSEPLAGHGGLPPS